MANFSLMSLPFVSLVLASVILIAAGATKGVIGIGLPIIAVPLLSKVVPLPTAVALMTIPLAVTNFVQAAFGTERSIVVLRRLVPMLIGTVAGVIVGVHLLTGLSPQVSKPLVGAVLVLVAALMLTSPKLVCPAQLEPVLSPVAGVAAGILGGLAGQAGPLAGVYLLSVGITGDRFVQYSSMFLFISALILAGALKHAGAIDRSGIIISAVATMPILVGMWAGRRLRSIVPAGLFRKLVLFLVILSGLDLLGPGTVDLFGRHTQPVVVAAPLDATR